MDIITQIRIKIQKLMEKLEQAEMDGDYNEVSMLQEKISELKNKLHNLEYDYDELER